MIIKNIFKIHFLFYLTAFICFITGNFKKFIIFTSIIIVHELGHLFGAFIFKWKIEKVILLPFGGITIFNEKLDKPLLEEFLIAILGPLFQFLFYLIYKENHIFNYYNKFIFIFNLLPIYPLDGSKIINVLLNKFLPFKLSHKITIINSLIILFIMIMYKKDLIFIFIMIFIFLEILKEIKKHHYYFEKILLEKYLYKTRYKKSKIIKNINQIKKQTNHIIKINSKYYLEKDFISKLFDK